MAGARRKARKRALDLLFEADQRHLDPLDVLALRQAAGDPPVAAYAAEIVQGVTAHAGEIDALIGPALSAGWSLGRLPAVDRALLRIAVFELRFGDVPPAVAISEAVGLAGELSTDESSSYVNGVLAAIGSAAPA
ncbi:MAG TPA: transcription antitermination factor NusB [Mycobacteriales bacterium]